MPMSPTPTIVLSVMLSAGAAAGVAFALRPAAEPAAPGVDAELAAELRALRTAHEALQQEVGRLRSAPVVATPASLPAERTTASLDARQVAAAVEAYLQQRDTAAGAEATAEGDFDLDRDFAALVGSNYWNDPSGWKKAFEAGRMDEVIARFRELADANPKDVGAKMDLARAYMAYQQLDPSKWQNSVKADEVLDSVLAIDDHHWEARFTKAVSYTFWPDFLGKKKQAISHFETLVAQQELQPAQPHQAQTYLYLGNMLQESDPQRAAEIWAQGLRRHPNDPELQAKQQ